MNLTNSITDIPGLIVGHAQNDEALTGCTVIICKDGAVAGVDQRGGAPGTRETDLLKPSHLVNHVHAIVLSGGSAFGLDSASGVMRYLEEKDIGFNTHIAKIPIVPAAILFDLGIGDPNIRPDADMGYQACVNASTDRPAEGNVGAGTGATVGKIFGMSQAMKSGIGTASIEIGAGVVVGALVAVNAFGDIISPRTGEIVAGTRSKKVGPLQIGAPGYFADTLEVMKTFIGRTALGFASRENTVIGCVATNAVFGKEEINKIAQMAQNGIAHTIRPANTMLDGDTTFALSLGSKKADVSTVGAFAAEALSEAIVNAVKAAKPIAGLPAAS